MALLLKCLKMKLNRFSNELKRFGLGLTDGNAARKIRNIGSDAVWTMLNNNHIAHT